MPDPKTASLVERTSKRDPVHVDTHQDQGLPAEERGCTSSWLWSSLRFTGQNVLDEDEKVLKAFDLDYSYGPAIGMSV